MSYYKILGFQKEPFSTSPDPDFLYLAKDHDTVLVNTLIELRLKRGLSVILGDVGTGKTSLSRKLIQDLKTRDDFVFHIVLDPSFDDEKTFLNYLARSFSIPTDAPEVTILLKEALEKFLFQKAVIEQRCVVLIIGTSPPKDTDVSVISSPTTILSVCSFISSFWLLSIHRLRRINRKRKIVIQHPLHNSFAKRCIRIDNIHRKQHPFRVNPATRTPFNFLRCKRF